MKIKTSIYILIVIIFLGCQEKRTKPVLGKIVETTYINEFFGVEFNFGNNWKVVDSVSNENLIKRCIDLISNGDKNIKKNAKKLMEENLLLLNLENMTDSSSMLFFAEKGTEKFWQESDLEKYVGQIKSLLDTTKLEYEYLNEDGEKVYINGNDLRLLRTTLKSNFNTNKFQDFYIRRIKDYYFVIINTYGSDCQSSIKLIKEMKID